MKSRRVHITGASGTGVTTLGRALAGALAIPHHDTDDFFWRPTDPPYREARPAADRLRLLEELFLGRSDWVLSGSLVSWGDPILSLFDLVVFLRAPTEVRLRRLREREVRRYAAAAVAPGGWRHRESEDLIEWAARYDDGGLEEHSLARHEAWLGSLRCSILRLDGTLSTADQVEQVMAVVPAMT
ncbi:MAG: AAA family ATPase [Alphaproteobacteria bacterium]|jgi:adenylate kinase family enzyme|nr:AAA family ATPase [Alphaproteobacteria bacterium]MDP6564215.1 AAA family ATPase [Alphaproteobacteria bacterium]MDP6815720.1 AAA family ATPase [Alphaproteobacteria bacterium]